MNIIILLFVLSSIVIILCLEKIKMIIAGNLYGLCALIMLLLYSIITDNVFIASISKSLIPSKIYDFIYFGLNNKNYVFSYIAILSFVTVVQVIITIFIIEKKLLSSKRTIVIESKISINNYKSKSYIFKEEVQEKKLSFNRVYIGLCRMIN